MQSFGVILNKAETAGDGEAIASQVSEDRCRGGKLANFPLINSLMAANDSLTEDTAALD